MAGTEPAVSAPNRLETSFVPYLFKKQLAQNPNWTSGQAIEEDNAALLWIDIFHFSPLCNRLMKNPLSGVEKITGILKQHYDFLLEVVTAHGGQPLFFVGDGLMCAWTGAAGQGTEKVHLAVACAQNILDTRTTTDDQDELLNVHLVVAYGPWQMGELAGIHGHKLLSFAGNAFIDLAQVTQNRAPNQILISAAALTLLPKEWNSTPVANGASIVEAPPAPSSIPALPKLELSKAIIQELKSFAPRTISFPISLERLQWISEIRPVNILFVRLPNIGEDASENLDRLRALSELTTPLVLKYGGLLNQIWMDDKESNIFISFGPSLSAHVDNPKRCVSLAFELNQALMKAGFENGIGVATGKAFCGFIGNDTLRQYTVIGDVVNLSARLAGIQMNSIFCDQATFRAARKKIEFTEPVLKDIKGQPEPLPVYTPIALPTQENLKSKSEILIGRERESASLRRALYRAQGGASTLVAVEADSGMGKTKFLEDFADKIPMESARVLKANGDFILRNTPYHIWASLFASLLEVDQFEPARDQDRILESLPEAYRDRAALLNVVLQTNFPDSPAINKLTGSQRAAATQAFLLEILENFGAQQSLVVLMDDAQWLEENGWQLIEAGLERLDGLLIVLGLQKTENSPIPEPLRIQIHQNIILDSLTIADQERLIAAHLGVSTVAPEVSELVHKITKGNPFFCIELVSSLEDQDLLKIEHDHCELKPNAHIDESSMPETVRGALRRRIDRLEPGSRLSLKVGSVVGIRFPQKVVRQIYPIAIEREAVPSFLTKAKQSGFINDQVVDNLEGYFFDNATIAEVAYEMTLAEQRRHLHRECASWYEQSFQANLQPFYVRLAYHWLEAGELVNAVEYQEKEAIRLFRLGFVKQALDVGLEGVRLLGYDFERDPERIGQKIQELMGFIGEFMADKSIESLINHKPLEDKNTEKLIHLILELTPYAHQSQQAELFALMALVCMSLTLEQGNGADAAEVYSMYAIIHKALTQDSRGAYAWSNLALEVDKKKGSNRFARVAFIHCWFIALWLDPLRDLIPFAQKGAEAGFASGDIVYGCFNLSLHLILKSSSGYPLQEVVDTAAAHFSKNENLVINASFHLIHEEQVAKAFQGKTQQYTSLTDEKYDEEQDIASICNTDLYNQIAYYLISKLKLNFHFGNWAEAVQWGDQALPLLPAFASQPGHIELEQYFTMAALYHAAASEGEKADRYAKAGQEGIKRLTAYAVLGPSNCEHKTLLAQAIAQGIEGSKQEAEGLFRQAAEKAGKGGFIQDQGLAYEHLARLKRSHGEDFQEVLGLAIEAYRKWGAHAKVDYLLEEFTLKRS